MAAFIGLVACGGREEDVPLVRKERLSVEAERACADSAVSLCGRIETCSPRVLAYFFGSKASCEANVEAACRERYGGPGATDTPAPCRAEDLRCELLERLDTLTIGASLYDLCPVSPGRFADGARCIDRGDCRSGRCGSCGACEPPAREDASCSRDSACAEGLACIDGRCKRGTFEGDACSESHDCTAWIALSCEGGICKRRGDAGESCRIDGAGCDLGKGLICDCGGTDCRAEEAYSCRPIPIAHEGDACNGDLPSLSDASAYVCDGSTSCRDGICERAGQYGDTCSYERPCTRALQCVAGRCALRGHGPPEATCVDLD